MTICYNKIKNKCIGVIHIFDKKLQDITEEDLHNLIKNKVIENKTLEYKEKLNLSKDNDKKEFLADITAFANSEGGYIIYGIRENKGLPVEFLGIEDKDQDKDKLTQTINNLLQDGVSPRIADVKLHFLELNNEKQILIIKILQSFMSPHRVVIKGHNEFYARNSNGKYKMDVNELRTAFMFQQNILHEIQDNYKRRINEITEQFNGDERKCPLILLEFMPISGFKFNTYLNQSKIKSIAENTRLKDSFGSNSVINIEGVKREIGGLQYLFYKHKDIVEIATKGYIVQEEKEVDERIINGLIQFYDLVIELYKQFDIQPPIVLNMALLYAKGYSLKINNVWEQKKIKLDRDLLIIPGITIYDFNEDGKQVLKPLFNLIWNAFGYEECTVW